MSSITTTKNPGAAKGVHANNFFVLLETIVAQHKHPFVLPFGDYVAYGMEAMWYEQLPRNTEGSTVKLICLDHNKQSMTKTLIHTTVD